LDEVVGIPPLPFQPISLILGIVAVSIGLYLGVASTRALKILGSGANAFVLTKRVVESNIYTITRNPMSLGYYLVCVGVGLMVGSTFVTVGTLVATIPTHLFFLKYFEELELELRFGQAYLEYKRKVPFLIPRFTVGILQPRE
jgi:protein-S-isoprenylcysteine O-methyltransferase Ste14